MFSLLPCQVMFVSSCEHLFVGVNIWQIRVTETYCCATRLSSLVYFTPGRQFHEVKNVPIVRDMWANVWKHSRYGSNIETCLEICLVQMRNTTGHSFWSLFRIWEGIKLPRDVGPREIIIWVRHWSLLEEKNKTWWINWLSNDYNFPF